MFVRAAVSQLPMQGAYPSAHKISLDIFYQTAEWRRGIASLHARWLGKVVFSKKVFQMLTPLMARKHAKLLTEIATTIQRQLSVKSLAEISHCTYGIPLGANAGYISVTIQMLESVSLHTLKANQRSHLLVLSTSSSPPSFLRAARDPVRHTLEPQVFLRS